MANLREGLLLGVGNPLLDISCTVTPAFLKKYNLEPNGVIQANDKLHGGLVDDMRNHFQVDESPGGAAQSAMRAVQCILGKPKITTCFGTIGDDDDGRKMKRLTLEAGVNAVYQVDLNKPTGKCACLISEETGQRSLVAFQGASNNFTLDHVKLNYEWIDKAKVFYVSGFQLAVCFEEILELAKHAQRNSEKTFTMNLSAPYISEFFSRQLLEVLPYVDILFGNHIEAMAFAKMKKWQANDLNEIVNRIANEPYNRKDKQRLVIITRENDSILVSKTNDTQIKEYKVNKLDEKAVVDTNGAGDAFVGGFLAQFIQNQSLEVCVKCGIYLASEVIQLSGVTFPKENKFKSS